jgi:NAD-dependent deacetylase
VKKVIILSGAGMSAESGIKTFRDSDGTWENHRIEDVATPQAWQKNKQLVLDFYNQRRRQLVEVSPNEGHCALKKLEDYFDTKIITQNVDDLHERAGSKNVLYLHGELLKVRSTKDENLIYEWKKDLLIGDVCEKGHQLRPHIVWFNEDVPMIEIAAKLISDADIVIVIGTSMVVYPAASLVYHTSENCRFYVINPDKNAKVTGINNITYINKNAAESVPTLVDELIKSI